MKRLMILALALLPCPVLRAQSFNLATQRVPVVSLDALWHFHTGDDPRWADPNFDDTRWALLRSDESWAQQGYPGLGGYAWYRFKLKTPDGTQPLSLLLMAIRTSYRVYADGKLLGGRGYFLPHHLTLETQPEVYDLPRSNQAGPRTIQIAIRVWHDPLWASYAPGGSLEHGNIAGDSNLVHERLHLLARTSASEITNTYTYVVLAALFGLLALGLFVLRPADREYLWFALVLLASAADAIDTLLGYYWLPIEIRDLIDGCMGSLLLTAALLFFSIVLRARRSPWWWIAMDAACLAPITPFFYWFGWTSVPTSAVVGIFCVLPAQLWILIVLVRGAARKVGDARLLLFPVLLLFGYSVTSNLFTIAFQFAWQKTIIFFDPILVHQPYALALSDVINTVFAFSMMVFLIRRFSLARSEEERLAREFEAARNIQALLIPASAPATPGFEVETVYLPASEVGGDFFHIDQGSDGSLLVVAGDVSGKGLKAAMTVSAIIGALRGCEHRQPAAVLGYLNCVLHGNVSGFATCTAALIAADGSMTTANAGNPAPYCNGKEMNVEPGLPLGVTQESAYVECAHRLNPGDRLTFISDGVVEATNERRELFGFERTRAISDQPAAFIADAARQFGQEDDISVIAVVCTGAAGAAV